MMINIQYIEKDITTVTRGVIAHGVNCQGAFGAGVAGAIKKKWPKVYKRFKNAPTGHKMLGISETIFIDNMNLVVINCYTQEFYGRAKKKYADPDAIYRSLRGAAGLANLYELDLYIPRIGTGLGGLNWKTEVLPEVKKVSSHIPDLNIIVCEW